MVSEKRSFNRPTKVCSWIILEQRTCQPGCLTIATPMLMPTTCPFSLCHYSRLGPGNRGWPQGGVKNSYTLTAPNTSMKCPTLLAICSMLISGLSSRKESPESTGTTFGLHGMFLRTTQRDWHSNHKTKEHAVQMRLLMQWRKLMLEAHAPRLVCVQTSWESLVDLQPIFWTTPTRHLLLCTW